MAAIDSLLRLIAAQKADALRIRPDAAPALLREDGERPLSMPPLPAEMVARFLEEITPVGRSAPPDQPEEFTHVTGTGEPFRVSVDRAGDRLLRATFRPGAGGASAPKEPGSTTVAAAAAGSSPPVGAGPPVSALPAPTASPAPGGATPAPGLTPAPTPAPTPGLLSTPAVAPSGASVPVAGAPGLRPAVPASAPAAALASAPAPTRPPPRALLSLLADAAAREASDVFLSTGRPARWRLLGTLSTVDDVIPGPGDLEALLGTQLNEAARTRLATTGSVDLAFAPPSGAKGVTPRFRVSLFQEELGLAAAFRPIRSRVPSPEELHLPAAVTRLTEHRHGLVLMTGPTGSGKSTTLASLIEQLNRTVARHVITIEDPIEFRYTPQRCLIHQRELGIHVTSFADGIRSALRSAPDVILVGEMRDPETIAAALTAAETGHLVLSTLHCGTAGMAVDRIIDGFPQARQNQVRLQLSDVLRSVVSQRLLPAQGGGRVPALEVMHVTHAVAALIRDGRGHQIPNQIQTGRDAGMVSLERSLAELVRASLISTATAMGAADDPTHLQGLLGR